MSLEVVLSDEALLAVRTLELSVAKVSLNMRLDVFFPSKTFFAIWEEANPFSVRRVRS
jgi:hypothetical protein